MAALPFTWGSELTCVAELVTEITSDAPATKRAYACVQTYIHIYFTNNRTEKFPTVFFKVRPWEISI